MFPSDFEAETQRFVESEFAAGRLLCWLAEEDGAFAGLVAVLLWPRPPQPEDLRTTEAYVLNMYVPPAFQRRGVGRQLLTACFDVAEEYGIRKYLLHSTEAGRRLYESTGFATKANWYERVELVSPHA